MRLQTTVTPAMRAVRMALLVMAIAGLLLGIWAGLIRLGWGTLMPLRPTLPALHGPLMACGFLGVLIGLERAVGTGKRWAYAGPALTALGILVALAGIGGSFGPLLVTAGSVIVTLVLLGLVQLQPAFFTATLAAGGAAWTVGNLLWTLGHPLPVASLWWMGFLVLTIAGERLELSRMLKLSPWGYRSFLIAVGVLASGLIIGTFTFAAGTAISGGGLLLIGLWLLRYDIAQRRLRAEGQARFTALALISGYVWLVVGALLLMRYAGATAGPFYDAAMHSVFLGFVFAMIFAHAPIVFPAVLNIPMQYTARFYIPLVLLHGTLLVRVGGNLLGWWEGRLWGGLLNAATILLFLLTTVTALRPRSHSVATTQTSLVAK
uniref:NnrS family protein n=1 Tax=Caldilinea aerophila TaxID=133453 RepID=A0A7C1JMA3_9CHLR